MLSFCVFVCLFVVVVLVFFFSARLKAIGHRWDNILCVGAFQFKITSSLIVFYLHRPPVLI